MWSCTPVGGLEHALSGAPILQSGQRIFVGEPGHFSGDARHVGTQLVFFKIGNGRVINQPLFKRSRAFVRGKRFLQLTKTFVCRRDSVPGVAQKGNGSAVKKIARLPECVDRLGKPAQLEIGGADGTHGRTLIATQAYHCKFLKCHS